MTECLGDEEGSVPWKIGLGSGFARNVVWGSTCGGADCAGPWSTSVGVTLTYAGANATTVVWGSSDGDTVVWGSTCSDVSCQPILWNKP
jgi:hypothetical protein